MARPAVLEIEARIRAGNPAQGCGKESGIGRISGRSAQSIPIAAGRGSVAEARSVI